MARINGQNYVVSVDQIEKAYQAAIRCAKSRFPIGLQREHAIDRVTDAVMRAAQKYDETRCESFEKYAYHCAWLSLRHVSTMNLHLAESLADDQFPDVSNSETNRVDWSILPEPLRAVCTFHIDYGFTQKQTGLLCGITRPAVKKRLLAAAEILNLP